MTDNLVVCLMAKTCPGSKVCKHRLPHPRYENGTCEVGCYHSPPDVRFTCIDANPCDSCKTSPCPFKQSETS